MWSVPVTRSLYARKRNVPCEVGTVASARRLTRRRAAGTSGGVEASTSSRYAMSCSIVITGMPSRSPISIRPGRRIIEPSSATTSPIAATGWRPASFISSTPASV
jgi:hypothetical protein